MTFSIRKIIRGLAAPEHRLSCSSKLWRAGLTELRRRTEGHHESGAFLLGSCNSDRRTVARFVYYDELDRHCLDTGIVVFDGAGYGPLWQICRKSGLTVVADIHTHPGGEGQSCSDRDNPMIAKSGHVALIVPQFAERVFGAGEIGVYEYEGQHRWRNHSGSKAERFFYIGYWG